MVLTNALAKFFEMPKSVMPAPPQQSSLTEIWGGKKKQKVGPKSDETSMDICGHDAEGMFGVMPFLQISYSLGEHSKRKKPTSVGGRLHINGSSCCPYSPQYVVERINIKKRRILDSDEEIQGGAC